MFRSKLLTFSLGLAGILLMTSQTNAASRNSLTVVINGLRNQKGNLCVNLFNHEQGFPGKAEDAIQSKCLPTSQAGSVTFSNLASGNYAIAVLHDENGDGKLNTKLFGIPKEGIGFSRNPRLRMSAPTFRDTAIALNDQDTNIQVQMKYF